MTEQSTGRLYRRLLSYVFPHKLPFLLAILGFVIYAASNPLLAHMMGVLEQTLKDPTEQRIYLLIAALFGIFLVRGVGTFLGKFFIAVVGRNVVHSLRTTLFNKMTTLPNAYYDAESSGRMLSRVTYDVEQVMEASTRSLTTLVQEGLTVILLMGYLIYLDFTLTLIFIAIAPVIGVVVSSASRFFRRYSKRIQQAMGNVTQVTNEAIHGYREVRTYGAIEVEQKRFEKASDYNRKQALKFGLTDAINVPLTQQIVAMGLGVMIFIMFQRVADGTMGSAEFLQFITAAALIAKPLRSVTDVNGMIQKGVTAAASVFEILDSKSETDNGTHIADQVSGQVQIKDLTLRYQGSDSNALNGINLNVEAGTSVALVGRSGSGKSTLVNLIPRFYELTSGNILIDGVNVYDYKLANLRKHIAFVSQQVVLFQGSIRDNIAYGELAGKSDDEIIAAAKAAHADEFIARLPNGYNTLLGDNGTNLSGGQRQRIAIARAILKNAPILILDEATSALDTESERHIQAALEQVMQGRTTFVIAHRLSTVENCDRIVVIDKGEVKEQGSHNELIEQDGLYAQLHKIQFQS
ncbi:MAG: lipid A export permease/ATP-binding protein MsbA [Venatoribacter sp.]